MTGDDEYPSTELGSSVASKEPRVRTRQGTGISFFSLTRFRGGLYVSVPVSKVGVRRLQ